MTTDRAGVQAQLAEVVSVECPREQHPLWDKHCTTLSLHHPDCDCQGSGRKWLLRKNCPIQVGGHYHRNWVCEDCNESVERYDQANHNCSIRGDCVECGGTTYVYNDAEDALTEAIRALGLILDVFADPSDEGDWVIIYQSPIDDNPATVKPSEGLRGRAAVEVCLDRAWEKLRAVEQEA